MSDARTKIGKMLDACGAVLIRSKKHLIWQLPNGRKFTQSSTPSDHRACANQIRDLRKELGEVPVSKVGQRRERRNKPGRTEEPKIHPTVNGALAEKLLLSGVAEKALRDTIAQLKSDLDLAKKSRCWWCQIKTKIRESL